MPARQNRIARKHLFQPIQALLSETDCYRNNPNTRRYIVNLVERKKERKKEDHDGCFQGTLFVQGTTITLVIKGALTMGVKAGRRKKYGIWHMYSQLIGGERQGDCVEGVCILCLHIVLKAFAYCVG